MTVRRRALAALGAAACGGALAGCGFRLRGAAVMPFSTLYLGFPSSTTLSADLRRALRNTGTRLVDLPQEAEVRLDVLSETRERDISAYSTSGRPREYQLRLRVRFRARDASDRELIPVSEILLRRQISVNDSLGTLSADEVALLYRDMENDMIQQLIRRLAAVRGTA